MISNLEKEVTLRYLKTRKKDGFLNIISIFSFIGISLGVGVLIIDKAKLKDNNLKLISKDLIFSNSGEAIIIKKNFTKGVALRGYKNNDFPKLEIFKENDFVGDISNLTQNFISVGSELSYDLNVKVGDKIMMMSSSGVETIIGSLPKQQTFIVSSIFKSGLAEFDQNVVFTNLETLESFLNLKVDERVLEIFLKKPIQISKTKIYLQKIFPDEYIFTWADLNKSLFSALKVERNVMFIILSLIIVVAAFNIISGLTILVKNKTKEIAILKSIGVLNKSIKKIFFLVGIIIGTSATIFGIFLGVTFSIYVENIRIFISRVFNISIFPEEIYFLSKMPSEINIPSIIIIALCSIFMTVIVSIFPAIKASKLDPVKGLKYE